MPQVTISSHASFCRLAGQGEFGSPAISESSPVRLVAFNTSIANAFWLPALVERFEVEDVNSPSKRCADSRLEELLRIDSAGVGIAVVRSTYDK